MSKDKKKSKLVSSTISTVKLSMQERHKRVWEAFFYSHQRIDVLLITISGAGIYVSFETLKYLLDEGMAVSLLIKIAPIFLLSAIVFNFLSQWCASKVHFNDYCISTIEFGCQEDGTDRNNDSEAINKHDCQAKIYGKIDSVLSSSSILLMIAGLTLLLIYFLITF